MKFPAVIGITSVNSSRVIVPREVSRVAVGFAMNIELQENGLKVTWGIYRPVTYGVILFVTGKVINLSKNLTT